MLYIPAIALITYQYVPLPYLGEFELSAPISIKKMQMYLIFPQINFAHAVRITHIIGYWSDRRHENINISVYALYVFTQRRHQRKWIHTTLIFNLSRISE